MDGCVQKPKDFEFSNKKWFNWASSVDAGKGSTSDNKDYGNRAGWLRVKVASSVLTPGGGGEVNLVTLSEPISVRHVVPGRVLSAVAEVDVGI